MIDVYSWATPNGNKVHIMLEECGLLYNSHPIDIGKNDQFAPDFLEISPNHKIPAIVDQEGPGGKPLAMFESCAILLYLAEKTGRLQPLEQLGRWELMQWLMFQVGTVGPMLGQAHHFRLYAPERIPYATERYTLEAKRIYGVLESRLTGRSYILGAEYTIADIAVYPWIRHWDRQGINWSDFPYLHAWFELVGERPAVKRGVKVLQHLRD